MPEHVRFGPLISPEVLMSSKQPIRLLDTRPGTKAYATGHLEGALHADLNRWLSTASAPGFDPSCGGRHPLPAPHVWAAHLGSWGIGPGTRVVAYDGAAGGKGACRLWWMLRAFGHSAVAVLDGGLAAAQTAGLRLTTAEPSAVRAVSSYPCDRWRRPTVDIRSLERVLHDPQWKVLDVRRRERWLGEVETRDPVAGRIPGSVNLPFCDNLGAGDRYKAPEALRQMYLDLLAGTSPQCLVVYCGSGVTACHTLLALDLAELHGASLYVGSYSEWCRSGKPLARGPAQDASRSL
jgi:thiosulfate/3-mercaptopyruvate sulfurtransferase